MPHSGLLNPIHTLPFDCETTQVDTFLNIHYFLFIVVYLVLMDPKVQEAIAKVFNDNQKGGKVLTYQMANYLKLVNKKLDVDEEELENKLNELDANEEGSFDLATFSKLVEYFLAKL